MRLLIVALLLATLLPACSDDTTGPKPATGPGELLVLTLGPRGRNSRGTVRPDDDNSDASFLRVVVISGRLQRRP